MGNKIFKLIKTVLEIVGGPADSSDDGMLMSGGGDYLQVTVRFITGLVTLESSPSPLGVHLSKVENFD